MGAAWYSAPGHCKDWPTDCIPTRWCRAPSTLSGSARTRPGGRPPTPKLRALGHAQRVAGAAAAALEPETMKDCIGRAASARLPRDLEVGWHKGGATVFFAARSAPAREACVQRISTQGIMLQLEPPRRSDRLGRGAEAFPFCSFKTRHASLRALNAGRAHALHRRLLVTAPAPRSAGRPAPTRSAPAVPRIRRLSRSRVPRR